MDGLVRSLYAGVSSGTQHAELGGLHYEEVNGNRFLKAALEMQDSVFMLRMSSALLAPGEKACAWGTNCVLVCFGFRLLA